MRNRYIEIVFLFLLCSFGCKRKDMPVVEILDYSYNSGWAYSFSLKVYSDGKGYLIKNNLKTDSLFSMAQIQLDSLNKVITQIEKSNALPKYEDPGLQDGPSFNTFISLDEKKIAKYYVYGNKCPEALIKLRTLTLNLSKADEWRLLKDTIIKFVSLENFRFVPKKIDTTSRFLPPKP